MLNWVIFKDLEWNPLFYSQILGVRGQGNKSKDTSLNNLWINDINVSLNFRQHMFIYEHIFDKISTKKKTKQKEHFFFFFYRSLLQLYPTYNVNIYTDTY